MRGLHRRDSNASGAVTSAPACLGVIAPVPRSTVAAIYLTAEQPAITCIWIHDAFGPGNAWQPLSDFTVTNAPQLCFRIFRVRQRRNAFIARGRPTLRRRRPGWNWAWPPKSL